MRIPGGGGEGGLDPIGKSHVIWVDQDLLPPLTKISGSAHGGQFISLGCIRRDCLMEDQARDDSLPARCLGSRGWGGNLIFSYIRRLGPFFWGQIFEFQYFLEFSEK